MHRLGVAMDLGTSGFRAQAVDCQSGRVLATVITIAHPLPGANVIDHLHFALELGVDKAREIMLRTVNRILKALPVPTERIDCLVLCGNTAQLSLFQGMEIRDLIYPGSQKVKTMGVAIPDRSGRVVKGRATGLRGLGKGCDVIVPPSVCHTVGADALALILQSGMPWEERTCLATDYGTNAEMALCHQGRIHTASAAAGPALEGQQISCGMLAAPGALVDLEKRDALYRCMILDDQLLPAPGPLVDFQHSCTPTITDGPIMGITGTGAVAIIEQAMDAGLVRLPTILTADRKLFLDQQVYFSEQDLHEAGKAIGAIRAGHLTLCHEAGISSEEIDVVYMGGASGTYVDAIKAQKIGLLPGQVSSIHQIGNTSLKMAKDLIMDGSVLEKMNTLAARIAGDHCMLAASDIFKKIFILELSRWTEGLPADIYRKLLRRYGLADVSSEIKKAAVIRPSERDIEHLGARGLILQDPAWQICRRPEGCTACMACVQECPQQALEMVSESDPELLLEVSLCNGVACRRCEQICPEQVFSLDVFFTHLPQD